MSSVLIQSLFAKNASEAIFSFLHYVMDILAYLNNPPSFSLVTRVASALRILAFLVIIPWIFLMSLDVASYLIVRTLGADTAHRIDLSSQGVFKGQGTDDLVSTIQVPFDSTSGQSSPTKQVSSQLLVESASSDNGSTTTCDSESEPIVILKNRTRYLPLQKDIEI